MCSGRWSRWSPSRMRWCFYLVLRQSAHDVEVLCQDRYYLRLLGLDFLSLFSQLVQTRDWKIFDVIIETTRIKSLVGKQSNNSGKSCWTSSKTSIGWSSCWGSTFSWTDSTTLGRGTWGLTSLIGGGRWNKKCCGVKVIVCGTVGWAYATRRIFPFSNLRSNSRLRRRSCLVRFEMRSARSTSTSCAVKVDVNLW